MDTNGLLSRERGRRALLQRELEECDKALAELQEKAELEARMHRDRQRLLELNEPPELRAARQEALRKKEKEEAVRRAEERRKEEAARPPWWPLPGPNMSKQEQADWFADHDL